MSTKPRSLREWVAWSTAGALLLVGWFVFAAWTLVTVHPEIFHMDIFVLHLLKERSSLWIAGLAIGGALTLWPQKRIRDGIRRDLWSETELTPVRRTVFRGFVWAAGIFLLSGVCFLLGRIKDNHPLMVSIWPCLVLFYWTFGMVQSIGARPIQAISQSRERLLADMEPIRSEHWGER